VDALGEAADRNAAAAIELGMRRRVARVGRRQIKQRSRALRLEYMRPVARIGAQRFANDPALRAALWMPRRPEALVSAASAMANAAEGDQDAFEERLRRAANSVFQAIGQRAREVARRSAAAAAVQGEVVRVRTAMSAVGAMVGTRGEGARVASSFGFGGVGEQSSVPPRRAAYSSADVCRRRWLGGGVGGDAPVVHASPASAPCDGVIPTDKAIIAIKYGMMQYIWREGSSSCHIFAKVALRPRSIRHAPPIG